MKTDTPFRIISLSILAFKRIEAMQINPDDLKPIILKGDNEQGKSSILDAIAAVMDKNAVTTPIQIGQTKAKIKMEIGAETVEYVLERTFTAKGEYLQITDATGAQVPSAQTFLNGLFNSVAIDPLAFMAMKPKEQAEALCAALGLTEKMKAIDIEVETLEDERKGVNRDLKSLEVRVAAILPAPNGTPSELIVLSELSKQIEEHNARVVAHDREVLNLKNASESVRRAKDAVERIQRQLEDAQSVLESEKGKEGTAEKVAEELRAPAEAARTLLPTLRTKLNTAEATNKHVQSKKDRIKLQKEALDASQKADGLTKKITDKRADKVKLVKEAQIPVEGLELHDDGLRKDGLPLSDLNTAEQIKVCCALAMAEKPKLRVLVIREGALCNDANKKIIFDVARENSFQCWMEVFQATDDGSGIWIEDGTIKRG